MRVRRAIAILVVVVLFVASFVIADVSPRETFRSAASLLRMAFWDKGTLVGTIPLTPRDSANTLSDAERSREQSSKAGTGVARSTCSFHADDAPDHGTVLFSEIAWMGNEESAQNEWIELANISDSPATIGGWSILDEGEQISFLFPANTTIPPHGFFLLERNEKAVLGVRADALFAGGLRNTDEGLRLFDDDCNVLDEALAHSKWPAGDNATKRTMERDFADLSWHASATAGGTPAVQNSLPPIPQRAIAIPSLNTQKPSNAAAPAPTSTAPEQQPKSAAPIQQQLCEPRVLISEIMAGAESGSLYEFVELYNPTDCTIDLTGWTIKKRSSTGSESTLVAASRLEGKSVPPKSYFLLANEGGYTGSVPPDVQWPKSYTLAYTNNAVAIYGASGEIADQTTWSEIPKGQSWTRASWESNQFSIQNPSPRSLQ